MDTVGSLGAACAGTMRRCSRCGSKTNCRVVNERIFNFATFKARLRWGGRISTPAALISNEKRANSNRIQTVIKTDKPATPAGGTTLSFNVFLQIPAQQSFVGPQAVVGATAKHVGDLSGLAAAA
jgi:hypothetical protein